MHKKIAPEFTWLFRLLIQDGKILFLVLGFALLFMSLSQGAILFLLKPFLNLLLGSPAASEFITLQEILPKGLQGFSWASDIAIAKKNLVIWVPVLILAAGLIRLVAIFFYNFYQQKIVLRFSLRLREEYFKRIISQDFLVFKKHPVGYFNALVINNVENLKQRMSDFFISMIKDLVLILSGVGFLFVIHPFAAGMVMLASPLLAYLMGKAGSKIAFYARKSQEEVSHIGGEMTFLRQKLIFVRLQDGQALENRIFDTTNNAYIFAMLKTVILRSAFAPIIEFGGVLFIAYLFYRFGVASNDNAIDSVIFMQFIAALGLILKSLVSFGSQIASASDFWGTLRHAGKTLGKLSSQVKKGKNFSEKLVIEQGNPEQIQGALSLGSVKHSYPGGEHTLSVRHLLFIPGSTVAVIGSNGAGKSTFLKILSGIITPDIWEAGLSWEGTCQQEVAYISQEPFVFEESIRSNLTYASETTVKSDEIARILDCLDLTEKLMELPEGLDTIMRNFRQNFSGGEMQRLSIARALLRFDKRLYLFDEVTASLDVSTEKRVLKNIFAELKPRGKIILMVTHRLEQLILFDRVIFFEGGKIIFDGTPEEIQHLPEFIRLKSELSIGASN